jgi:hypothetical protein
LQLLTSDVLQAWQYDPAKARTQADFSWLDEPGVWQEIDSYAVSCPASCVHVHECMPASVYKCVPERQPVRGLVPAKNGMSGTHPQTPNRNNTDGEQQY